MVLEIQKILLLFIEIHNYNYIVRVKRRTCSGITFVPENFGTEVVDDWNSVEELFKESLLRNSVRMKGVLTVSTETLKGIK